MSIPALVVAGTHSGSGKTAVTLALLAALVERGVRVQAFKVGPDFIDPAHHARITGRPSRNLDTWLMGPGALRDSFLRGAQGADIAVIEGVMGLFDGRGPCDELGSTADLARQWGLPVILVVDARGMARSIAAVVQGFTRFDERVQVAGVVANRVGSRRHYEQYLVPALRECAAGQPLGFLERSEALEVPSRHLGLVMAGELPRGRWDPTELARAAEAGLDIEHILALARPPTFEPEDVSTSDSAAPPKNKVRIGLARDRAFCFYYEDNLDLLRAAGAEIVPFSPLADQGLPDGVQLVYLGGGYPELCADQLAANSAMRAAMRAYHRAGGTILAECGGLMACCNELRDSTGRAHEMWGLVPAKVAMQKRFAALGYVTVHTERPTCLGPAGTELRGHEFHYSRLEPAGPLDYATRLLRPDRPPQPDGIQVEGLLANYAHMHFGSSHDVARRLVQAARDPSSFA